MSVRAQEPHNSGGKKDGCLTLPHETQESGQYRADARQINKKKHTQSTYGLPSLTKRPSSRTQRIQNYQQQW